MLSLGYMHNYFNQSIGHGLSQRKAPVLSKGPPQNPGVLSNHTDILGISYTLFTLHKTTMLARFSTVQHGY